MNKLSIKAKNLMIPFMKEIYDEIHADWGTGFDFQSDRLSSHLLFLRINELFQSVMLLLENDFPVTAAMQLRPLSEAFILMKASILNPKSDFNERYLKKSSTQKSDWLKKIIKDHDKSAFPKDRSHYKGLREQNLASQNEDVSLLKQIPQLFEDFEELDMYLHIYMTGNLYLHHDARSLNVYFNKENKQFVEASDRDYSGVYIHTAYAAVYVMLRTYAFHSEIIGKKNNQYERLFNKFLKHNDEIGEKIRGDSQT